MKTITVDISDVGRVLLPNRHIMLTKGFDYREEPICYLKLKEHTKQHLVFEALLEDGAELPEDMEAHWGGFVNKATIMGGKRYIEEMELAVVGLFPKRNGSTRERAYLLTDEVA